jgi:hypothetical protein
MAGVEEGLKSSGRDGDWVDGVTFISKAVAIAIDYSV